MCRFLVFTLPPEADLDVLQPLFAQSSQGRLHFAPFQNDSLASQLPTGTMLGSLTHGECDCGTALGAAAPADFEVDPAKLKKVRRKGWSQAKIERWIRDQCKAQQSSAAAERQAHNEELRSWCQLIDSCLESGATASFGVLSHWYESGARAEELRIERQTVRRDALTPELLYRLEDDCVYEFCA